MAARSAHDTPITQSWIDELWRLWADLGVSGWRQEPCDLSVDIDSLVVATGIVADHDARLRDEVLDWCVQQRTVLSKPRLRTLAEDLPGAAASAYGQFAATLADAARLPGIGESERPYRFEQTDKSSGPPRDSSSAWGIRLRDAFGVSARSELVRILTGTAGQWSDAADLAWEATYSRRNVADALAGLARSGITERRRNGQRWQHRLMKRAPLDDLVGPIASKAPVWRAVLIVISHITAWETARRDMPAALVQVETTRTARSIGPASARLRLPVAPLPDRAVDESDLRSWTAELLHVLAE